MASNPADSCHLRAVGRAPTQAPVVRVFDALLVPTSEGGTDDECKTYPPVGRWRSTSEAT